ncbi:MAG: PEP-CTERM sorting domain-containing protein [Verrucomicrobiota bacterium]
MRNITTRHLIRKRWKHGLLALVSISFLARSACADRPATFWNSASGDFFEFSNWSQGTPNSSLDARIDNGGIARITAFSDQTIPYVYLGSAQNTSGTLEIGAGGTASFTTMIVGALNATGTLNILNGGKLTSFGGPIGSDYLGVGLATVDGATSSWKVTGSDMVIGGNGKGTVRLQNSGSLQVAGGAGRIELANHPVAEGNLTIGNGGAAGTLSASEIFNGQGKGTVTFNHSDAAFVFAPKLSGIKTVNGYLNVRHEGSGTTILSATESNLAGSITVAAGTLLVNGRIMGSFTDVVIDDQLVQEKTTGETTVLANGTLGGAGFIEGKTTVAGTLAPGSGLGVLKFGGDLSLESTASVKMELGGELRGTQFDGVDLAGSITYGGTLKITLLNGFVPGEASTFDLFNGFTAYSGTFTEIVFNADGFAGSFNPETGVLSVIAVPEPGILGLTFFGMTLLALRRRNRNSHRSAL